ETSLESTPETPDVARLTPTISPAELSRDPKVVGSEKPRFRPPGRAIATVIDEAATSTENSIKVFGRPGVPNQIANSFPAPTVAVDGSQTRPLLLAQVTESPISDASTARGTLHRRNIAVTNRPKVIRVICFLLACGRCRSWFRATD